jgi:adenosine deaminase
VVTSDEKAKLLQRYVVGLDWVGDEHGYPYCVLAHSAAKNLVTKFREATSNPRFGIRIHAGEGVPRQSSKPVPASDAFGAACADAFTGRISVQAAGEDWQRMAAAFEMHMHISMACLRRVEEGMPSAPPGSKHLPSSLRIGHGVAFLQTEMETDALAAVGGTGASGGAASATPCDGVRTATGDALKEFRAWLKEKRVVLELNPTSNHMLLTDSCVSKDGANTRTLPIFLQEGLLVVLCTDDDGIWAIHKCPHHYQHTSVAYEFCQAIERCEITTADQLDELVNRAYAAAFSPAPP